MKLFLAVFCSTIAGCKEEFNLEKAYRPEFLEYSHIFESKYGPISPNQSWDFTNSIPASIDDFQIFDCRIIDGLKFDFSSRNAVDIEGPNGIAYYNIKNEISTSKFEFVPNALLISPSSEFRIYPFITNSSHQFDLCVKVGENQPITLFKKNWVESNEYYCNGTVVGEEENVIVMNGLQIEASKGTPIQVYTVSYGDVHNVVNTTNLVKLKTTGKAAIEGNDNDCLAEYYGIGRFDRTISQWILDVVFMVVAKNNELFMSKISDEGLLINGNTCKRYLVENLGKTDGSDFNDVVFDINRTSVLKSELENGIIQSVQFNHFEYDAHLRHLGDTLFWVLKIGDCIPFDGWQKGEIQGSLFQIPDKEGLINLDFSKEPWDPDKNNVTLYVNWEQDLSKVPDWSENKTGYTKDGIFTIPFPKNGEVPCILAVETTEPWRSEKDVATPSWWKNLGYNK